MTKPRIHYSLKHLFIGTAVIAIGTAALVNPSYAWANVVVGLLVAVLLTACALSCLPHSRSRPFWLSFAVVGCMHLVFVFGRPVPSMIWSFDTLERMEEDYLPTNRLLSYIFRTWIWERETESLYGAKNTSQDLEPIRKAVFS